MVVDFQIVPTSPKDRHSLWDGGVEEVMALKCICGHEGGQRAWHRPPWWKRIGLSDGFDEPYYFLRRKKEFFVIFFFEQWKTTTMANPP
jgi:hypothetical protein